MLSSGRAFAGEDLTGLTDRWNALLQKHVRMNGGVAYIGMEQDQVELDAFLNGHAALDVKSLGEDEKKAVLINLYNAGMVAHLLRYARDNKLDVKTKVFSDLKINDLKVPGGNIWNGSYKVKLQGFELTLDEIEHGLLRGEATGELAALKVKALDPRIHAAVNCAALSCPRLREVAYRGASIDRMLDENMREFVSTEHQFTKVSDGKMRANSIVYWYYGDFPKAGDFLAGFLDKDARDAAWKAKHLRENFNDRSKLALKLSSAFDFDYDWRVNDVRNK